MSAVRLHHVVEGARSAPWLVLSSSLGTTLEMWDDQTGALEGSFRIVRFDRRGHGRSPVPPGPYSIDDLGSDLLALLDRLEIERATYCGLSLGGCEGMWLAANAPERVDRLVLCCTDRSFGEPEPWQERAATVRAQGVVEIADAALGRWFTPAFRQARPEVIRGFREMLAETPAGGYAACCEAIAGLDLGPDLARIDAPTLVVTGEHDPVVTPDAGQQLAAAIPDARAIVINDAAHLANVERPEAFNRELLAFLSSAAVVEQ
jgi:3-oxoadipate enol-lactonase